MPRGMFKRSKNNTYQNKKWLYQKYIVEILSTYRVGQICNCSNEVLNFIKKPKEIEKK